MSDLNPGIVKTVEWLREQGFNTVDSGDGETHEFECDLPMPYVHMRVEDVGQMAAEAQRLERTLRLQKGVNTGPCNEDGTAPCIEAHYNPADGYAIISLYNVRL